MRIKQFKVEMLGSICLVRLLLLIVLLRIGICFAQQNDDLFPAKLGAVDAITFDGRGFIINGKPTFIMSGSVHYARVPQENWHDILLKLKRCGFNCVETYVFWNYHEPHEGQFNFTTAGRDLGAFLDAAKSLGLYAIVRVGPYSCAEWENGGFPTWLYFKQGLEVRKQNQVFYRYVDAWMNKLLPILSTRQIQRGGNVILVQLENELPTDNWSHWGTSEDKDGYLKHLLDLAHNNGLEVPMFFSGLHHGHDPAPGNPIDSLQRKSPWMSTELWTIWFDRYGNSSDDLLKGERSTWRVLAQGGNGFNLYMFYGGTSFDFFNFNDDEKYGDHREKAMASYDYGTLVGQAGDTRTLYYRLKREAYFADAFSAILANSTNTTKQFQDFARGATITARSATEGTLVFLDNSRTRETNAVLKSGVDIKLAAGEIAAFPLQISIAPDLQIAEADARILGIVSQNCIKTLICYGETGDCGKITFVSNKPATADIVNNRIFQLSIQEGKSNLIFHFPTNDVGEENLVFGTNRLRILVMNKDTADLTWIVETKAGRQIVIGAPYLGDYFVGASGKVKAILDFPWNNTAPTNLSIYGDSEFRNIKLPELSKTRCIESLPLAPWVMSSDIAPLADKYNDEDWFTLPDGRPPQMGEDGDYSAYAWYRTRLTNSSPIKTINFRRIGDRATFFVDGEFATNYDFQQNETTKIQLNIPAGSHIVSAFVAHAGRTKLGGVVGSINWIGAQKGLCGPVTADERSDTIKGWKMRGGVNPTNPRLKWNSATATNGAPAYYRTCFQLDHAPESGATYRFGTDGLSFGNLWLNGHNVGRYPEILKGCPGLWLPICWMKPGLNMLVIYDERGFAPVKTTVKLEAEASRHQLTVIQ